jgi:DNA-binding response OmpR family regulator
MEGTMHLTIVDDDQRLLETYKDLMTDSFELSLIDNPHDLKAFIRKNHTDLILMDLNMPQINGLDLFKLMQNELRVTPVILISSNANDEDVIRGLDLGIADFILRPIPNSILISRIKNKVKSLGRELPPKDHLIQKSFNLIDEFEAILINGKKYRLTTYEFKILSFLARDTKKIHTVEKINQAIWPNTNVSNHSLATHINNLKKKVPPLSRMIVNKRGIGYYLDLE